MALDYRKTQVQRPSSKPSTDNSGSNYYVRHRRVNLDDGVTEWSKAVQTNLPATITPQSYHNNNEYLRDEILISDDNTAYYIVPRDTDGKGSITIDSLDTSWDTASNEDTQGSTITSINFGEFSTGNNPTKIIFVYNDGSSIENLTFNLSDNSNYQTASQYFEKLQISLNGTYSYTGSGPSTLYNKTIVWGDPNNSFNTIPVLLPKRSFCKIEFTLIDFPSFGFDSNNLDLNLKISSNRRNFKLPLGHNWFPNSIKTDLIDFFPSIFEPDTSSTVKIKPFILENNGRLIANYFKKSLSLGSGVAPGDKFHVVVSPKGVILKYNDSNYSSIPEQFFILGDFEIGTDGKATNFNYNYHIKPNHWSQLPLGSVSEGLFVKTKGDTVEVCESENEVIGVSLGNNYFTTEGRAWIKLGESITAGTRVQPGLGGKAYAAPEGKFLLREGGNTDEIKVVETLSLTSYVFENPVSNEPNVTFNDITQPNYQPTVDLNFGEIRDTAFTDPHTIPSELKFTRASQATRVAANGYIQTVSADVPRINHDPLTKENKGLLLENAKTNFLKYSEYKSAFSRSDVTLTSVSTPFSPGKTDCILVEENTQTDKKHVVFNGNISKNSSNYYFSAFVKPNGRTKFQLRYYNGSNHLNLDTFDLESETPSEQIEKYPNNWYRIWSTISNDSVKQCHLRLLNSNGDDKYTGDGSSGIYTWGWQVEEINNNGQKPSSYIPTSGSEVTRAEDRAIIDVQEYRELINPEKGTIYLDFGDFDSRLYGKVFTFGKAFTIDRRDTNTFKIWWWGELDEDLNIPAQSKEFYQIVSSWENNNFYYKDSLNKSFKNLSISDSFYEYNLNKSDIFISFGWKNTGNNIDGHIRRFIYMSNELTTEADMDKMLKNPLKLTYPSAGFSDVVLPELGQAPTTDVAEAKLFVQNGQLKLRGESNGPIYDFPSPFAVLENTYTTASLSDGSSENFSLDIGKLGTFVDIEADVACWVVAYSDSTARSNDSTRDVNTEPDTGSGVLMETVFSSANTIRLTPAINYVNTEDPVTSTIYFKVENQSGSSTSINITLRTIKIY